MDSPKQEGMKAAAAVLRRGGTGALSVLDVKSGAPFTTLVNIAVDEGMHPVILTSGLSHHTQCLRADPRASILLHDDLPPDGDPLTGLRVTLTGVFVPDAEQATAHAFLTRHPYAALYAGFGDFGFWRMLPDRAHIIAGFGRAYSVGFADLAKT